MLKQETMKARQKGPRVHAMVKGAPSNEAGASIGGDGESARATRGTREGGRTVWYEERRWPTRLPPYELVEQSTGRRVGIFREWARATHSPASRRHSGRPGGLMSRRAPKQSRQACTP